MIEKGIYDILRYNAALLLLAPNISFGVEPGNMVAPSQTQIKNYIVFYRSATIPYDTKSGRSTLDDAQIQINLFSKSATELSDLAETVRGALDRTSGTFGGCVIQSIQYTNQVSLFEFNETYNTKGLYQMTQYYQCRFEPSYL
tara:strand:- start:17734 stop:18162 length:429 start_codon:yes stop_codon:yes gene_type:complete